MVALASLVETAYTTARGQGGEAAEQLVFHYGQSSYDATTGNVAPGAGTVAVQAINIGIDQRDNPPIEGVVGRYIVLLSDIKDSEGKVIEIGDGAKATRTRDGLSLVVLRVRLDPTGTTAEMDMGRNQ